MEEVYVADVTSTQVSTSNWHSGVSMVGARQTSWQHSLNAITAEYQEGYLHQGVLVVAPLYDLREMGFEPLGIPQQILHTPPPATQHQRQPASISGLVAVERPVWRGAWRSCRRRGCPPVTQSTHTVYNI